jgi:hypothetical protein
MTRNIIIIIALFTFSTSSFAMSLLGRLGIGTTNQVVTGIDALSIKLQRNRSTALSGLFGLNNSSDSSNYAIGAKVYRLIYDEPQLNFYSSLAAIMFTYQNDGNTESGYQVDGGFGTEFSLQGLESIGFSFEFGIGLNKYNGGSNIQTYGHHIVTSAVHFYL